MQQLVALTANVTAAGGVAVNQGTVTFTVRNSGGAVVGAAATSGTVTNGAATANYTLPAGAAPGDYSIEAAYNPGENFAGSAGAGALTIQKAATSVALASSVNPSAFGQSVTFTATVTSGGGNPTGKVDFRDGATFLAQANLNGGSATLTLSNLSVGAHNITATYLGNANFQASVSPAVPQTVNAANTATALAASVNPSVFGQSVTFTATVTAQPPGGGTPAGTVQFFDGATLLGAGTLNAQGRATLAVANLSVATHSITAAYTGAAGYNASLSPAVAQVVNKAATTTSLAGPNNSNVGQSVTFTATVAAVAPGSGAPAGAVQFKINGVNAAGGLKTLVNGQASYTTNTLPAGSYIITAEYQGNASYNASSGTKSHRRR
jgi:hypothetical protein